MDGSSTACVNRGGPKSSGLVFVEAQHEITAAGRGRRGETGDESSPFIVIEYVEQPQSSTESNRWPSDPSSNGVPHQEAASRPRSLAFFLAISMAIGAASTPVAFQAQPHGH
jgi:hypothetical protein